MKSERLMKLLFLMQSGTILTTAQLSKELGVSARTIHRDMESLSSAGIPIYSERGKHGGWKLMDDWKSRLSWLNEDERLSLFLPPPEKVIQDLNMNLSVDDIRHKLLLSMPQSSTQRAKRLWERLYVDVGTWRGEEHQYPVLEILQDAVMTERKVILNYEKANGEKTKVRISPLGLVAKSSTWYVCALNEAEQYRNYKVSRVMEAKLVDEHFERPEEFRLRDFWEKSKAQFVKDLPEYRSTIEVSPQAYRRMMFTGRFFKKEKETELVSGWKELELNFPTEDEALGFVLSFGHEVRVLSPTSLIDRVLEQAERVIESYEKQR
ncbi:YafY family transcriptional regulator [Halobacillus fulvus]|nr:YafY family transcriptional regulator [Halobacillus fulvus]